MDHEIRSILHQVAEGRMSPDQALPSVLVGMLGKHIIALPTSVGYGVSMQGLTALAGMLSSCATGIAAVNIDNGFGAAAMAEKLLMQLRGY